MKQVIRGLVCLVVAAMALSASAYGESIPDVPRVDSSTKRWSLHISALHASLHAMDCPATYEELMVASGGAFRTTWWPGWYSYLAPPLAPEDLVANGAIAVGALLERYQPGTPEEAWPLICDSIDGGRPVIVWASWGGPRVICGYDPQGQRMYIRDYRAASEEYRLMPFEMAGAPWPRSLPNEITMLDYDPGQPDPTLDWVAILDRAIRFADWPADEKLYGHFAFGPAAYDSWAETLRGGVDDNGPETDATAAEWTARVLSDARRCASVVLQANAEAHEAFADAASLYMEEAKLLGGMAGVLSRGEKGDWNAVREAMTANFADEDVREQAALLVEQAKDKDAQAIDALRLALAALREHPQ